MDQLFSVNIFSKEAIDLADLSTLQILAKSDSSHKKELFGLSVIEYLNYDPWSGHDTFDQKVLFRVISPRINDPQVDILVFKCHVPTIGHNQGTL